MYLVLRRVANQHDLRTPPKNLDVVGVDPTVCEVSKIAVRFDLRDILERRGLLTMPQRVACPDIPQGPEYGRPAHSFGFFQSV